MARLFIGLVLPPEVAAPLAELARGALPEARFRCYPARDLHLTLCFLGEHDLAPDVAARPAGRSRLERTLVDETRGLPAPELRVVGVGAFPDTAEARVLWAGVAEEPGTEGRLAALQNRALSAALAAGWRPANSERARPFRPHVTLARPRGEGPAEAELRPFLGLRPRGAWVASEVALLESRPEEPTARYHPVAEVPLQVRPG